MKESTPIVVIDSTIWIDLRKSGLIKAFFRLPFLFHVSDFIVAEVTTEIEWDALFALGLQVIPLTPDELSQISGIFQNHATTSFPDLATLFVAIKSKGILLTGDDALRNYSKGTVEVHGFLWIMDYLVNEDIVSPSSAISILENLLLDPLVRLPEIECRHQINKWKRMII